MKILTKNKQEELMHDLLTLYTLGSDGLKAVGTMQEDKITPMQAFRRQQKMTAAAMNAAHILRGLYGIQLMIAVDKWKKEEEEQHGFPLQLKDKGQGEQDIKEALDTIAELDIELVEQYSAQDYDRWRRAVQTLQRFLQPILTDRKPNE